MRYQILLIYLLLSCCCGVLTTAQVAMWPSTCSGITTDYTVPTAGGQYESVGCTFGSFVHITASDPTTALSRVVVRSGWVGPGNDTGIGLIGPSFLDAVSMPPIHFIVQDMAFEQDAVLRFIGALPPNSSLVVANNRFHLTTFNTFSGAGMVGDYFVAAVIVMGEAGDDFALSDGAVLAIANNTIGATLHNASVVTIGIYLNPSTLSVTESSTLSIDGNEFRNADIVGGSDTYPAYLVLIRAMALNASLGSAISASNNQIINSTVWNATCVVHLDAEVIGADTLSTISFDANKVSTSRIIYGMSQVVHFTSAYAITASHGSRVTVDYNGISSTEVDLGDLYAVRLESTIGINFDATSGSSLSMCGNSLLGSIANGGSVKAVSIVALGGLMFNLLSNSSFTFDDNTISQTTPNGGSAHTLYVLTSSGISVQAFFQSSLSVSGNQIHREQVNSGIGVAVYWRSVASTTFTLSGLSSLALSNNSIDTAVINGQGATALYMGSESSFVDLYISDGSAARFDGNYITNTTANGGRIIAVYLLSQTGITITVESLSSLTINANSVTHSVGNGGGANAALFQTLAMGFTVAVTDDSVLSVVSNYIHSMVSNGGSSVTVYWTAPSRVGIVLKSNGTLAATNNSVSYAQSTTGSGVIPFFLQSSGGDIVVNLADQSQLLMDDNLATHALVYSGGMYPIMWLANSGAMSLAATNNSTFSMSRNRAENATCFAYSTVAVYMQCYLDLDILLSHHSSMSVSGNTVWEVLVSGNGASAVFWSVPGATNLTIRDHSSYSMQHNNISDMTLNGGTTFAVGFSSSSGSQTQIFIGVEYYSSAAIDDNAMQNILVNGNGATTVNLASSNSLSLSVSSHSTASISKNRITSTTMNGGVAYAVLLSSTSVATAVSDSSSLALDSNKINTLIVSGNGGHAVCFVSSSLMTFIVSNGSDTSMTGNGIANATFNGGGAYGVALKSSSGIGWSIVDASTLKVNSNTIKDVTGNGAGSYVVYWVASDLMTFKVTTSTVSLSLCKVTNTTASGYHGAGIYFQTYSSIVLSLSHSSSWLMDGNSVATFVGPGTALYGVYFLSYAPLTINVLLGSTMAMRGNSVGNVSVNNGVFGVCMQSYGGGSVAVSGSSRVIADDNHVRDAYCSGSSVIAVYWLLYGVVTLNVNGSSTISISSNTAINNLVFGGTIDGANWNSAGNTLFTILEGSGFMADDNVVRNASETGGTASSVTIMCQSQLTVLVANRSWLKIRNGNVTNEVSLGPMGSTVFLGCNADLIVTVDLHSTLAIQDIALTNASDIGTSVVKLRSTSFIYLHIGNSSIFDISGLSFIDGISRTDLHGLFLDGRAFITVSNLSLFSVIGVVLTNLAPDMGSSVVGINWPAIESISITANSTLQLEKVEGHNITAEVVELVSIVMDFTGSGDGSVKVEGHSLFAIGGCTMTGANATNASAVKLLGDRITVANSSTLSLNGNAIIAIANVSVAEVLTLGSQGGSLTIGSKSVVTFDGNTLDMSDSASLAEVGTILQSTSIVTLVDDATMTVIGNTAIKASSAVEFSEIRSANGILTSVAVTGNQFELASGATIGCPAVALNLHKVHGLGSLAVTANTVSLLSAVPDACPALRIGSLDSIPLISISSNQLSSNQMAYFEFGNVSVPSSGTMQLIGNSHAFTGNSVSISAGQLFSVVGELTIGGDGRMNVERNTVSAPNAAPLATSPPYLLVNASTVVLGSGSVVYECQDTLFGLAIYRPFIANYFYPTDIATMVTMCATATASLSTSPVPNSTHSSEVSASQAKERSLSIAVDPSESLEAVATMSLVAPSQTIQMITTTSTAITTTAATGTTSTIATEITSPMTTSEANTSATGAFIVTSTASSYTTTTPMESSTVALASTTTPITTEPTTSVYSSSTSASANTAATSTTATTTEPTTSVYSSSTSASASTAATSTTATTTEPTTSAFISSTSAASISSAVTSISTTSTAATSTAATSTAATDTQTMTTTTSTTETSSSTTEMTASVEDTNQTSNIENASATTVSTLTVDYTSATTLMVSTTEVNFTTTLPAVGEGSSAAVAGSSKAIGIVSSLLFLIGDGTSIEVQLMVAMMLAAPCASAWDRNSMLVLRYFLSPFIDLGSIAVIVTHIGIALIITVAHFGIVFVVRSSKLSSSNLASVVAPDFSCWRVACAYCFFPAVPMLIVAVLYMGVAFASMEAFVSKNTSQIVVAAILGIPFVVLIPGLTWLVITQSTATFELFSPSGPSLEESDEKREDKNVVSSYIPTGLIPKGRWAPAVENRLILGAHGWVRSPSLRFVALAAPYGIGLLFAIISVTVTNCRTRYAILCFITGAACLFMAAVRPHRTLVASLLSSVAYGSLCLLSGAQLVALANGEASSATETLRLIAMVVLLISVFFRSIHAGLVLCIYREPVFGNDDDSVHANVNVEDLDGFAVNEEIEQKAIADESKSQLSPKYSPNNSAPVSRVVSYQPSPQRDTWGMHEQDRIVGDADVAKEQPIRVSFDDDGSTQIMKLVVESDDQADIVQAGAVPNAPSP